MRKLSLTALILGTFACGAGEATTAPSQPTPPQPPAPSATIATAPAPTATAAAPAPAPRLSDKEQATIQGLFDAMGAHDAQKAASMYTNDALWRAAGFPENRGHDAIVASRQAALDSFPDLKLFARRIFLKGDTAIVEWTDAGTNTGPGITGGKPTGKAIGVNGASVFTFTPDGLAKEEREYADFPTMLAQLGLSKEKGRPIATPPTGAPEVHIAKGTAEEDENVATAKTVQGMFESHDVKGFADATADSATWEDLTSPGPAFGKEAIVSSFTRMTKAFPDLKAACESWGIEDFLIEECTMSGTNKGPMVAPGRKLPATNKVGEPPRRGHHADQGRQSRERQELRQRDGADGAAQPRQTGEAGKGRRAEGDDEAGQVSAAAGASVGWVRSSLRSPPRVCQIPPMADRYPSFFGPVLPQEPDAPEAFSFAELQQIRGRRIEADIQRTAPQIWAEGGRRPTLYPLPAAHTPQPPNGGGTPRLRVVVS